MRETKETTHSSFRHSQQTLMIQLGALVTMLITAKCTAGQSDMMLSKKFLSNNNIFLLNLFYHKINITYFYWKLYIIYFTLYICPDYIVKADIVQPLKLHSTRLRACKIDVRLLVTIVTAYITTTTTTKTSTNSGSVRDKFGLTVRFVIVRSWRKFLISTVYLFI